jgi:cbb3-type cytochrome oxidase subunit 3
VTTATYLLARTLGVGIPLILIGVWAWAQRRRARDSAEISAVLRRLN